jgi:hypothetical protein
MDPEEKSKTPEVFERVLLPRNLLRTLAHNKPYLL